MAKSDLLRRRAQEFLSMGYFLGQSDGDSAELDSFIRTLSSSCNSEPSEDEVFSSAIAWLDSWLSSRTNHCDELVVPLSGGYDSRLVIAMAREIVPIECIRTYTFGTPGTLDFELGSLLASKLKTKHTKIDLTRAVPNEQEARYNLKRQNYQTFTFLSTPFHILDKMIDPDAPVVTGFMGDPIAGSKLKPELKDDELIAQYKRDNVVTRFDIEPCFYSINESRIPGFTNYESMDFINRQFKYIKNAVCPADNYYSPFLSPEFINYFKRQPLRSRKGCLGYYKCCDRWAKDLFSIPLKNHYGYPSWLPKLMSKGILASSFYFRRLFNQSLVKPTLNYFDLSSYLDAVPDSHKYLNYYLNSSLSLVNSIKEENGKTIFKEKLNSIEIAILVSFALLNEELDSYE